MVVTLAYARDEVARYCGAWAKLADADLALVTDARWPQLRDVAAWQVYESALNNCDAVSLKAAGIDMDVKSATAYLMMRVERAYSAVRDRYNVGLGTLSAATLSLDFAAKGTDVDLGGGF